jgi:hypothetical protein
MKNIKVVKYVTFVLIIFINLKSSLQEDLVFLDDDQTKDTVLNLNFSNAANEEINLAGGKIINLTYGDKTARVRLDTEQTAYHLNSKPINCFQFSTANPKKDYPGSIVKFQINEKNLKLALKEEKAIQIVFKNGVSQFEEDGLIDPEKTYYLIGVMWYGGEFHFIRLFIDGWFSKPSKVGRGDWAIKEYKLPSEALGNLLARVSGSSVQRIYKFLGFYLHPNRNDYINQLLK